ncbi:MAG TPA: O-acetylhomoserine aminocarboxypropyltransferase/cysteine synthase [Candidatus Faecicola pullistercoris]|nr:O-acetylhomoserine aminocarboxypropyltransferase/cysteine synthase [Candidatus Faecicola pullistercoris]
MKYGKDTICVQGDYRPKNGDPRVLPLYQSTTYSYDTPEQLAFLFDSPKSGHIYSRISNPTVSALENKVTMLEGGVGAMATSSGMAATTLAVMTVCEGGDNIISLSTIYGGTYNLFNVTLKKYGIECRFVTPDSTDEDIEKLIDGKTKMIFAETVANPAMVALDFDRFARICKKHKLLFVVDNTLATPCLVRPFEHGANVIVHSTTKYMDGHAAAVGGLIVDGGNFEFDQNERYKDFYTPDESYHGVKYIEEGGAAAYILKARMQYMRDLGTSMSPFNAYLTNIGLETLHLRMARHSENALAVSRALALDPNVEWVKYPGLENDKYHDIASRYFKGGYSGMVVFGVKGGRAKAEQFIKNLKLIKQVTHIADVRSCVLHPASTTHRQLSDSDLVACGITDNLVRLSVGIENKEDIINDVLSALSAL